MTEFLLFIFSLIQQTAPIPQYPFAQTTKEWYETKKIGIVDLRTPGPMRFNLDQSLKLAKLDEKSVGFLDLNIFKIQVCDEKNLLLVPLTREDTQTVLENGPLPTLWLKNYPTKDLVDDTKVILIGAIKVTGTHTYEATQGAQRTVREIEFLKKDESEAIVKHLIDELVEFKKAKEPQFFTLKSKAGTEIEAKFVAFNSGKVELKTKDGRTLKLALDVFTKETADELRTYIKEYRAKK